MSNTSRKKYLLQSWQIHLRTCILCLRRKTCCYLPLGWVHTNANTHGSSVTKQTNRPRCVSASVCGQADPPSASCHRRDVYPICHDNLSSNRLRRRVPHCSYGYPHTHTHLGERSLIPTAWSVMKALSPILLAGILLISLSQTHVFVLKEKNFNIVCFAKQKNI